MTALIRRGWRDLARSPGFASLVVLTLALGIGANTALFSVVNGVLLNPLPGPHPERIAALYEATPGMAHAPVSYLNFLDWQREANSFAAMAIYRGESYNLTGAGTPVRLNGLMISAGFFRTLGVRPLLGRTFRADDDQPGAAPVALIGDRLWRRQFGASPTIVGQSLELNGVLYTIVGVAPPGFAFYGTDRDVYTPIGQWKDPSFRDRRIEMSARAVGRLKPGVRVGQAQAELDCIARNL
ncbi:MAG: ABC transporter permease, partial [Terriglobales bacterium]